MKNIVNLTEMDLYNLVVRVINEQNETEYYDISPEEYKQLIVAAGYNGKVLSKLKRFGGKTIRVTGKLNLSGLPITTLGDLYVNGGLDISRTKISDLEGVTVIGYTSYWDTPLEKIQIERKRQKELSDANDRRENGEWDLDDENIDEEGEAANALFRMLVNGNDINELDDDEKETLAELQTRLQTLTDRYDSLGEDDEEAYEIQNDIDDVQYEIDELLEKNNDVYGLIPDGNYYEMLVFKTLYDGIYDQRYAVGTEKQADDSLNEYVERLIDDIGYRGFNSWVVDSNIDGDKLAEYLEDDIRMWIQEEPESYGLEKVISQENLNRLREIESQIDDLKEMLGSGDIEEDEIENIENEIEELESEYSEIEDDEGEISDSDIEEKVDEYLNDVRRDPMRYIEDYGMEVTNFIDHDGFVEDVVRDSDYSNLGNYDGNYYYEDINGTTYYIIRLD